MCPGFWIRGAPMGPPESKALAIDIVLKPRLNTIKIINFDVKFKNISPKGLDMGGRNQKPNKVKRPNINKIKSEFSQKLKRPNFVSAFQK